MFSPPTILLKFISLYLPRISRHTYVFRKKMIRLILGFRILQKLLKTVLVVPNGGRAPQDAPGAPGDPGDQAFSPKLGEIERRHQEYIYIYIYVRAQRGKFSQKFIY